MQITSVSLVKCQFNNKKRVSISSQENNASSPSFGFLLSNKQKLLLAKYLPSARRRYYNDAISKSIINAKDSRGAKKDSDAVMMQAIKEAKANRRAERISKFLEFIHNFFGPKMFGPHTKGTR